VPVLSGTDKFGDIRLRQGKCEHCGKTTTRVDWMSFELPANIDPTARTLICNIDDRGNFRQTALPKLGITCGCYSSFHRQVAHVSSRQNGKT
jgi:hypothetical protein